MPLARLDREKVWREWGVDLQDTTRMPRNAEEAEECLWRWRGGEYIRSLYHNRPAPGDLERIESIATGHGDPTGREHPDPLPDNPAGDRSHEYIDWSELPLEPVQWFAGPRGRFWERRRLARLRRSWLEDGAYGYDGPREWHRRIIGQYMPEDARGEAAAEWLGKVVSIIPAALLVALGLLVGRVLP